LSIFQLPAVKLLEVLTHYANTGKETLSLFIDSSIDNFLLQTNPASTIPKLHLVDTLLQDLLLGPINMLGMFFTFCVYFNTYFA